MVTPELVSYIWSCRERGVTDPIIKANLRTQGWNEVDFAEAVATLPPPHTKITGPLLRKLNMNTVMTTPDTASPEEKARHKKYRVIGQGIMIFFLILIAIVVWGVIVLYIYNPVLLLGLYQKLLLI